MYHSLKAKGHKGVQKVVLSDLGRINVLCGRNNSGKTSILEALNDQQKQAVGIKISEEQITRLKEKCADVSKAYTTPNPRTMSAALNDALSTVLHAGDILFSDDLDSKNQMFNNIISDSILKSSNVRFSKNLALNEWIENLLKDSLVKPTTILIPPKRTLEHMAPINANQSVQSDGRVIVNYLFFLKNQALSSTEYLTYLNIDRAFKEVANGWTFNIFIDKDSKLTIHFTQDNKNWYGSDICGLGLSDILIVITLILAFDNNLILIEEPESHVHPDMQRRLLRFLKNLEDKQFIITTHSNVFLDNAFVERVLFCSIDDDGVKVVDTTSKASVLDDLGYSIVDNLISDLVILVEGPTDVPILEVLLSRLGLGEYNIRIWPLCGDNMAQFDLSVMVENRHCIALIDNDPGSARTRKRLIKKCEEIGMPVRQLKRYAIENYFPLRALQDVFGNEIQDTVTEIESDRKLENQIGFNVKNNNRKIASAMTVEEIEETEDLYDFIQQVRGICEGT